MPYQPDIDKALGRELLTVSEVARELDVSETTILREIADGKLVALRVRKTIIRIERDALSRYIRSVKSTTKRKAP
jgi:excisionase family DNA binding protein